MADGTTFDRLKKLIVEQLGVEISDEDAEKIQKVSDAVEFIEEHQ